jgi:hypothetical protein
MERVENHMVVDWWWESLERTRTEESDFDNEEEDADEEDE